MLQVTFAEIARVLEQLRSSVPAAEAHGCLCGALCASARYSKERWLEEIIVETAQREDPQSAQALEVLFTDTAGSLRGEDLDLELLLPDDETPLQVRATALSQWAQGFLYGFGTAAQGAEEALPANVNEILRDLTHIGRATVDLGEGSEEEEQAYAEVVEYVRAGVQLVHEELVDLRAEGQAAAAAGDDDGEPDADDDEDPGVTPADDDPSRVH